MLARTGYRFDGPSTSNGELALGKNLADRIYDLEGYNYEDAVLLSEKLKAERCLYIRSWGRGV